MVTIRRLKVVVDTNVLFEGLTHQGSAAGYVIEAWLADLLAVRVSNAVAYEYVDVLARKLSAARWEKVRPVLGVLLSKAEFVTVYFSWRPISPDKGDEHVIDCAMNAGAAVVTSNIKDFQLAEESLGLEVLTPVELLIKLVQE
jgi:predicted nucleic acid-binding protein